MKKMKIVLMGYGKGLKLISDVAKNYFELAGIFTQNEEFYSNNKEYFNNLRKYGLYEDIIDYCKNAKIEYFRTSSVTNPESISWFKEKNPDLVICYSIWEIIKEQFFNIFKNVFNTHGSNIPNLMGRAPQSWAILNGFDRIGYTIHKMTNKIDQGPIVKKCEVPILYDDIPLTIMKRQESVLKDLFESFCEAFVKGNISYTKVDIADGNYWPRLNTDIDGRLNWNLESFKIERMIRAFNRPFPGAWFPYKEEKLRFLEARIVDNPGFVSCMPGVVFKKNKNEMFVTSGDGYIAIKSVEYKNKKYNASELLRLGYVFNERQE